MEDYYATVTIKNFSDNDIWSYNDNDTFVQSVGTYKLLKKSLELAEQAFALQQKRITELEKELATYKGDNP